MFPYGLFRCLSNVLPALFMELLIGCLKTIQLEMGGGIKWVRVHMQLRVVVASVHVRTMEGRGQSFATLVRSYY